MNVLTRNEELLLKDQKHTKEKNSNQSSKTWKQRAPQKPKAKTNKVSQEKSKEKDLQTDARGKLHHQKVKF